MLLLTGANGQLAQAVQKLLPQCIAFSATQLDITDIAAVNSCIKQHKISTIINCAAYTKVDLAETETEQAWAVNHLGAANLASTGVRVIHISTDYVFDGSLQRPYNESDQTNPQTVYGKSKLAGEQAVLACSQSVVVRTSWLYSASGNNFFTTMLRLGKQHSQVKVVADQYGSPTNAADLAAVIYRLVENTEVVGLYHYAHKGVCSWAEFAQQIMLQAKLHCKVVPITSEQYPAVAKRPKFSPLDSEKICNILQIKQYDWFDRLVV
jgi:dTDP-4-dehydrorhamnose reductase